MSENVKIYCGSGKAFGNYGQIGISLCLDDLPSDYVTTSKNGKRYINLKLSPKQGTDQYGKTHYLEVDTWRPEKKSSFGQSNDFSNGSNGVPF